MMAPAVKAAAGLDSLLGRPLTGSESRGDLHKNL